MQGILLWRQVKSGAIQDVQITSADLKNYYSVYGTSSAYWKGRMTHKKISSLSQDDSLIENSIPQDFYSDIFTIGGQLFLLSLAWPLSLLIVTQIGARDATTIGTALQDQINIMWERN